MINPLKERRFGKVCIHKEVLESLTAQQLSYLFAHIGVIIECNASYVYRALNYIIANKYFEKVDPSHIIPKYMPIITIDPKTKEITQMVWKKVDNLELPDTVWTLTNG